jgi:hypothetical protein
MTAIRQEWHLLRAARLLTTITTTTKRTITRFPIISSSPNSSLPAAFALASSSPPPSETVRLAPSESNMTFNEGEEHKWHEENATESEANIKADREEITAKVDAVETTMKKLSEQVKEVKRWDFDG